MTDLGIGTGAVAELGDGPDRGSGSWSAVEHLVRTFRARSADEGELVTHICTETVRLIGPADEAGVILAGGRRHLDIVAATGTIPQALDELQQQTGSGPCLSAARHRQVVQVPDIATETRWGTFPARAAAMGVGAMLCLPLHVDDRSYGTLSLYASTPRSLGESVEPIARVLGVLVAITLSESRRTANLEKALASRDVIGQAKGIVMHARRITADDAFRLLVDRSQAANIKLADLAAQVVETGTL